MTISVESREGAPDGVRLVEVEIDQSDPTLTKRIPRGLETVVCTDDGKWYLFGVEWDGGLITSQVKRIKGLPEGKGGFIQGYGDEHETHLPAGKEYDLKEAHLTIRTW